VSCPFGTLETLSLRYGRWYGVGAGARPAVAFGG
jgi:hypothetical protein